MRPTQPTHFVTLCSCASEVLSLTGGVFVCKKLPSHRFSACGQHLPLLRGETDYRQEKFALRRCGRKDGGDPCGI